MNEEEKIPEPTEITEIPEAQSEEMQDAGPDGAAPLDPLPEETLVEEDEESAAQSEEELAFDQEGEEEDDELDRDDVIVLKRSHVYAVLIPLAFVLGLSVGYIFWGRGRAAPTAAVPQANPAGQSASSSGQTTTGQQPPAAAQEVVRYDVPVDDDPILGPDNAPITIIEFSDFECPFCRKWHEEVFGRLLDTYPGQIRFVYRDFPLTSIHPQAASAAEAANCAFDQGNYWEYHDRLFSMELGLGREAYEQYASDLGMDKVTFIECLDSRKYQEEVQADFEYAARLGVRSTPTFFINGIALVGAQPFEVFQQVIEQELAGEIP